MKRSGKPRAYLPCPHCTYRTNSVERMDAHLARHRGPREALTIRAVAVA